MTALAPFLGTLLLLQAPAPPARAAPAAAPAGASRRPTRASARGDPSKGPVILFLVDNSASLPPLDPDEKRVAALEKMFTFLQGPALSADPVRRRSARSTVDDVSQYNNRGQWTDIYSAFEKVREIVDTDTRRARTSAWSCSPTASWTPIPRSGRTRTSPPGWT